MTDSSAQLLSEREKELDFVYALAACLENADADESEAAAVCARLFARALAYPQLAVVRVRIGRVVAMFPTANDEYASADSWGLSAIGDGDAACSVQARYRDAGLSFSEREAALCSSAARLLTLAAARMAFVRDMRATHEQLEQKNAALSELLGRIELEKRHISNRLKTDIETRLLPILGQLENTDHNETQELAKKAKRELKRVFGSHGPEDPRLRLSAREYQIAELVSAGMTSKEIAKGLSISLATVERHRHTIRKKLGMEARVGSIALAFDPKLETLQQ